MPLTKNDVVNFLKSNPNINKLNFQLFTYRVYPSAYQRDVAQAFDKEIIQIRLKGASKGAGATYDLKYDTFEVDGGFSLALPSSQGFMVHESTHAHLDIQNFGKHSRAEGEAVAYLAEAMFMESSGYTPISTHSLRVVAQTIARKMLAGLYVVPPTDAALLVAEAVKEPHYAGKPAYVSNGFARSWLTNRLR